MFEQGNLGQSFMSLQELSHQNNMKISQLSEIEQQSIGQNQTIQQPPQIQNPDLNKKFTSVIAQLEMQIQDQHQQQLRMKAQFESEKKMIMNESRRENDQLQQEIRQLRSKQMSNESQVPLIKEALGQVRDMLSNFIPETLYLKLRDIPQANLTPSEWVLVNTWEIVYPYKRETELLKNEVSRLREEFKIQQDKMHMLLGELEHSTKLLNDKDEDYKRYCLNYENNKRNIELELQNAYKELNSLRSQGVLYDELRQKYKLMEQEKQLIEEKISFYDKENGHGKENGLLQDVYKQLDDFRRKNEILNRDKDYLTKENIQLLEKNKRIEDRGDRLEKDLLDAKDEVQKYLQQFLHFKNDSNLEFEKRINSELDSLRTAHQEELQQQRNNIMQIYDTQKRFAEKALDDLEEKYEKLQSEARADKQQFQSAIVDQKTHEQKYNNLQNELNFKVRALEDQLNRLDIQYQRASEELEQYKQKCKKLDDQVQDTKDLLYKQQVRQQDQNINLKAELAVAKEKLEQYQRIEKELDKAIENNDVSNILLQAPTLTNKRVEQSIKIAQQLQQKESQLQILQKKFQDLEQKVIDLENKNKILLTTAQKQGNAVYGAINDAISKYENYHELETEYIALKEDYNRLSLQYDQSQLQIESLQLKRDKILQIRQQLVELCTGQQPQFSNKLNMMMNDVQQALDQSFQKQQPSQQKPGSAKLSKLKQFLNK